MAPLTFALDIGGTKIAAGLVDSSGAAGAQGEAAHAPRRRRSGVGRREATDHRDDVRRRGPRRRHLLGRADPPSDRHGQPDQHRGVARLSDRRPGRRDSAGVPVRLGGDGLCMALGEHRHGAGRGAQFLLGMVVSTGVGGGLVLDGAPYDGATGNAGHVGHVVVDLDGQACSCGGRGCVETIAAGPRMARWARDHGWDAPARGRCERVRRRGDVAAMPWRWRLSAAADALSRR